MEIINILKSTLPALIRLGDFIGNEELTPPGGGRGSWWTPYDRCEIVGDVLAAIEQLEKESASDTETNRHHLAVLELLKKYDLGDACPGWGCCGGLMLDGACDMCGDTWAVNIVNNTKDTKGGNLVNQDEKDRNKEDRYETLYYEAVEAIDHIAQENWDNRVQAVKRYLRLVARDNGYTKSLDEIQEKVNLG